MSSANSWSGCLPCGRRQGLWFTLHAHTLIVYGVVNLREVQEVSQKMCQNCFPMLSRCPFRQAEFYRLLWDSTCIGLDPFTLCQFTGTLWTRFRAGSPALAPGWRGLVRVRELMICFNALILFFCHRPISRHGFQSFWWRTLKHDSALDVGGQDTTASWDSASHPSPDSKFHHASGKHEF